MYSLNPHFHFKIIFIRIFSKDQELKKIKFFLNVIYNIHPLICATYLDYEFDTAHRRKQNVDYACDGLYQLLMERILYKSLCSCWIFNKVFHFEIYFQVFHTSFYISNVFCFVLFVFFLIKSILYPRPNKKNSKKISHTTQKFYGNQSRVR